MTAFKRGARKNAVRSDFYWLLTALNTIKPICLAVGR